MNKIAFDADETGGTYYAPALPRSVPSSPSEPTPATYGSDGYHYQAIATTPVTSHTKRDPHWISGGDISSEPGSALRTPTSPPGTNWVVEPYYPPTPQYGSQFHEHIADQAPQRMTKARYMDRPSRIDTETPAPTYRSFSNDETLISPTQTLVQVEQFPGSSGNRTRRSS